MEMTRRNWIQSALLSSAFLLALPVAASSPHPEPDADGPASAEKTPTFRARCDERLQQFADRGYRVEPIIVTLPDPLETPFGREFDLLLAATFQAFEHLELTRDLHCLPWETESVAGASRGFTSDPGMILFRGRGPNGSERTVVPVLLVGEAPILGVHASALKSALRFAYEPIPSITDGMKEAADPAAESPRAIRILGPTFSGTALSINQVLTDWRNELLERWNREEDEVKERAAKCKRSPPEPAEPQERVRVTIRSGSATAANLNAQLTDGLEIAGDIRFAIDSGQLLATTLDQMACVWNAFVPERLGLDTQLPQESNLELDADHPCLPAKRNPKAADGRQLITTKPESTERIEEGDQAVGTDNHRVALLVESSAYGRAFEKSGFYVVQFPMHVSRLREVYDRHLREKNGEAGSDQTEEDRPEIELSRRPRGLPTYGGGATLASQEAELRAILQDLARRRFEVVGVVASDVMDKRFLVRQIRALAPGSRIVTFEKDLLLARAEPGESPPSGVLVASSFSVERPSAGDGEATDRETSSERPPERSPFSLDASEGVYYAARELLSGESGAPEKTVWLSVTGQGDLHTLQKEPLVDRKDDDAAGQDSGAAAKIGSSLQATFFDLAALKPRLPRGWSLLLSLVTATFMIALGHACRQVSWAGTDGGNPTSPPKRGLIFGLIPVELVDRPRWGKCRDLSDSSDRALHALVVLLPLVFGVPYLVLGVPAISEWLSRFVDERPKIFAPDLTLTGQLAPAVVLMFLILMLIIVVLLVGLASRTAHDAWNVLRHGSTAGQRPRWIEAAGVCVPLVVTVALVVIGSICAKAWIDQGWLENGGEYFIRRSLAPSSGASPLLPALLFGGILLGWIVLSLFRHRVRQAIPTREAIVRLALDRKAVPERVQEFVVQLRRAIDPASLWQRAGWIWSLLVATPILYLALYYGRLMPFLHTLERRGFDETVSLLFVLTIVVSVGAGISLLRGWTALREILEWLRLTDGGFEERDSWLERVRLAYKDAETSRDLAEFRRRESLATLLGHLESDDHPQAVKLRDRLAEADNVGPDEPAGRWMIVADWRQHAPMSTLVEKGQPTALGRAAREFFAWSTVRFVKAAFVQLLQLMGFMTIALLLILVGVSVYPFEPQRLLTMYVSTLIALGASLSIWVVLQARRERLLGALEGETAPPWQVLAGRLGMYAGLPILSVVANRIPELRRVLVDWLKPVLEAFG